MTERVQAITWEAPEHYQTKKTSDWYWVVGIVAVAAAVVAIMFNNTLFGIVILLGAFTTIIFAHREPNIIPFAVTQRGIRTGNELFPYSMLESFHIDDENAAGPLLLIRSKRLILPLLVIPIPEEYIDDIDDLIGTRLPEEHLEEPLSVKLLESVGL